MTFTFGQWVCPLCGSNEVETTTWVDANEGRIPIGNTIDFTHETGYCRSCDEELPQGLKWAEPPERED